MSDDQKRTGRGAWRSRKCAPACGSGSAPARPPGTSSTCSAQKVAARLRRASACRRPRSRRRRPRARHPADRPRGNARARPDRRWRRRDRPRPRPDQGRRRRAAARKDRRGRVRRAWWSSPMRSKLVDMLGRFPLPIEVNPFGLGATRRADRGRHGRTAGAEGGLRLRAGRRASRYVTDGGHSFSMLFLAAFRSQKRCRTACSTFRAWCSTGCSSACASGPMSPDRMASRQLTRDGPAARGKNGVEFKRWTRCDDVLRQARCRCRSSRSSLCLRRCGPCRPPPRKSRPSSWRWPASISI